MPTAGEWLALQWEDLQTERKFLSPAETYCALRLAAKAWLLDQAARGGAAAVSATLQHVPASGNVLFKLHGLEHGGATKTAILSAAAERLAQHVPLQLRSKAR